MHNLSKVVERVIRLLIFMKIHVFKNTTKKWELSFASPTKYYNCMEEYCILNILYIFACHAHSVHFLHL